MSRTLSSGLFVLGLGVTQLGERVAVAVEPDADESLAFLVAEDSGYLDSRPRDAHATLGADVSGCALLPCILGYSTLSDTSGLSGDLFGSALASVATDTSGTVGDLLVVGAPGRFPPNRPGGAYIYARSNYSWIKQREISASGATPGAQFGLSVGASRNASDGPFVAVGGPSADTSGFTDTGLYVTGRAPFSPPQSYGYTQIQLATPRITGARFGQTVDVDNFTLAVAAPGLGRVTVYTRGSPWNVEDQLPVPLDAGLNSEYGAALDLSGDLTVVGAPLADDGAKIDTGAVYLFRNSAGVWINEAKLIDPSGRTGDGFGRTVAVSGDVVVVGAPGAPGVGGAPGAGRAYVFERIATQWLLRNTLFAPDGSAGDGFGRFVAVSANRIIVGSPGDDFGAHTDRGSAYLFLRAGDVFTASAKLIAPEYTGLDRSGDLLGTAGTLTRTDAVVGAPGARLSQGGASKGVALVFPISFVTPREAPRPAALSDADDNTGASTATAGDWLVAGTPSDDVSGALDRGSVNFYERAGDTWVLRQTLSPAGAQSADRVGAAIAINAAANLVAVGAPGTNVGAGAGQGAIYLYTRTGATWSEGPREINASGLPGDEFGSSLSMSPDGSSIIVGAPLEANGTGAAYLLRNPAAPALAGKDLAASWKRALGSAPEQMTRPGGQIGDKFAASVSVTNEGMAIGAPGVNAGVGAAMVYRDDGLGNFDPAAPEMIPSIGVVGDKPAFGSAISISEGVLIVGAPQMDIADATNGNRQDQGSASIFSFVFGLQNFISQPTTLTAATGAIGDKFGAAVGATNGMVAIGAPETTVSREVQDGASTGVIELDNQGGVYTFLGTKPGSSQSEPFEWEQDAFVTADNGESSDEFGRSLALQRGRLAVGVPLRDGDDGGQNVQNVGAVYVYEGIAIDIVFGTGFE